MRHKSVKVLTKNKCIMKIIALKGRSNCGKSETLGVHLRRILKESNCISYKECWKDTRESIQVNGKVIDICPPGDTEEFVRDNIAFFEEHPCDVAFTATRSRGRGCWAVEEYAKEKGAELVWIEKEYNNDLNKEGQLKANKELTEKLFKMI